MDNKTLVSKIATNVIINYRVIYHIYPAAILNKSSITFILKYNSAIKKRLSNNQRIYIIF